MRFARLAAALVGLTLALSLGGFPSAARAQEKKEEEKKEQPNFDANTGKRLNEALEFLKTDNYAGARGVLDKLDRAKLSPYELSRVEQLYASISHAQEKYGEARQHLKAAIDAGGLNEVEIDGVRFNIAQLYLAEEKWKEGAAALEEWMRLPNSKPNSNAYYLLAVAYYQQGDEARALPNAEKALAMSEKPQPSWIQLVLALYLKKDQYGKAVPLIRQLIALEPNKKEHWVQLSSVLGAQEKYQDALTVMMLAYHKGLLTSDSELRRLADLLLYNEIPYRAATLLTKELEAKRVTNDGKLQEKLGNCWIAARDYDKAIGPLRRAAEMQRSADMYGRLGEVQVQREDWGGAIDALQHALNQGGLKDPGNAQMLLGISYYNLKKKSEARQWFQKAKGYSKHEKQAQGWIQAIDTEAGAK